MDLSLQGWCVEEWAIGDAMARSWLLVVSTYRPGLHRLGEGRGLGDEGHCDERLGRLHQNALRVEDLER